MSIPIPEQQCPYCGYVCNRTDAAFGADSPAPGDVSVCFRCTEISFFDADMNLRRPLPVELDLLSFRIRQQIEQIRVAKRKLNAEYN